MRRGLRRECACKLSRGLRRECACHVPVSHWSFEVGTRVCGMDGNDGMRKAKSKTNVVAVIVVQLMNKLSCTALVMSKLSPSGDEQTVVVESKLTTLVGLSRPSRKPARPSAPPKPASIPGQAGPKHVGGFGLGRLRRTAFRNALGGVSGPRGSACWRSTLPGILVSHPDSAIRLVQHSQPWHLAE